MKWHHIAGSVLHLAGWSFLLKCSFVLYRDGSMSRRSNAATGKDLLKTFRGNLTAVEAGDALLSLDGFCKKHSVLMKEILSITSRPTAAVMHEALGLVWPGAPALELKTFANHLHEVFKTLFTKTRNMSTGGKAARQCAGHVLLHQAGVARWPQQLSWEDRAAGIQESKLMLCEVEGLSQEEA